MPGRQRKRQRAATKVIARATAVPARALSSETVLVDLALEHARDVLQPGEFFSIADIPATEARPTVCECAGSMLAAPLEADCDASESAGGGVLAQQQLVGQLVFRLVHVKPRNMKTCRTYLFSLNKLLPSFVL